ncbi:hypothetical protein [Bradyrhizobium sp. S69]|uniref:hypothetical protein n=1 Tax=Bradyrhizobium sp. S69 TaxID=1641856 RepID=UPI00131E362F|nr:hypothetical protein [Bradyrhizobium sp. S69]
MSQNDPTDHALAAIASILDNSESRRDPETHREAEAHREPESDREPEADLQLEAHREPEADPQPEVHSQPEVLVVEDKPLAPEMVEAEGYSKIGPGPIAAIRFKWTVRHHADDDYYVDETIGENSAPIATGPMSRDAAVRMVDDREYEAQRKFDQLRSEMTGRAMAANLARHDSGES